MSYVVTIGWDGDSINTIYVGIKFPHEIKPISGFLINCNTQKISEIKHDNIYTLFWSMNFNKVKNLVLDESSIFISTFYFILDKEVGVLWDGFIEDFSLKLSEAVDSLNTYEIMKSLPI